MSEANFLERPMAAYICEQLKCIDVYSTLLYNTLTSLNQSNQKNVMDLALLKNVFREEH